jgi:hypothetical protein
LLKVTSLNENLSDSRKKGKKLSKNISSNISFSHSATQSVSFQTNEQESNYLSSIDKLISKKNLWNKDCLNKQKMGQKSSKFTYHLRNNFEEEPSTKVNGLVASQSLFNYDDFENINKTICSNEQRFDKKIQKDEAKTSLKYSKSFNNSFRPYLSENSRYDLLNVTLANNAMRNSASETFKNETSNVKLKNQSTENANYFSSENNSISVFTEQFSKSIGVEEETKNNRQSICSTLSSISSINTGSIAGNLSFKEYLNSKVCIFIYLEIFKKFLIKSFLRMKLIHLTILKRIIRKYVTIA